MLSIGSAQKSHLQRSCSSLMASQRKSVLPAAFGSLQEVFVFNTNFAPGLSQKKQKRDNFGTSPVQIWILQFGKSGAISFREKGLQKNKIKFETKITSTSLKTMTQKELRNLHLKLIDPFFSISPLVRSEDVLGKSGFMKGRVWRMCPRSGFCCRHSVFLYPCFGFW